MQCMARSSFRRTFLLLTVFHSLLQPCHEFYAQLDFESHPLCNTPLCIRLSSDAARCYYVDGGQDIQSWSTSILKSVASDMVASHAKKLTRHVAVQLLMALKQLEDKVGTLLPVAVCR